MRELERIVSRRRVYRVPRLDDGQSDHVSNATVVQGGSLKVREKHLNSSLPTSLESVFPSNPPKSELLIAIPTASALDSHFAVLEALSESACKHSVILSSVLSRLVSLSCARTLQKLARFMKQGGRRLEWRVLLDSFARREGGDGSATTTLGTIQYLSKFCSDPSITLVVLTENPDFQALVARECPRVWCLGTTAFLQRVGPGKCGSNELYERVKLMSESADASLQRYTEMSVSSGVTTTYAPHEKLPESLKGSEYFRGTVRLHAGWSGACRVCSEHEGHEESVVVPDWRARNRALEGDRVLVRRRRASPGIGDVVAVLTPSKTRFQRMVATLAIPDAELHARESTEGSLEEWVTVVPMNPLMPRMRLRTGGAASQLVSQRFVVEMDPNWPEDSKLPKAAYVSTVGPALIPATESSCIMIESGLAGHQVGFATAMIESVRARVLPELNCAALEDEAADPLRRRDARSRNVVSIDPRGCQDIDDALSLTRRDGAWELGIHIADVDYFVSKRSDLDVEAEARATSVYLQERRYDMLPALLSGDLASIRPNRPRHALSVFWTLRGATIEEAAQRLARGEFDSPRFYRTLIESKYALTYEQADSILHGREPAAYPGEGWTGGAVAGADLSWLRESVAGLDCLARARKLQREGQGGLNLHENGSAEFSFELDASQRPVAVAAHVHLGVHDTIAELMILANEAVARELLRRLPRRALVRRHPPASPERFKGVIHICQRLGVVFDARDNKAVGESLQRVRRELSEANARLVESLVVRTMSEAQYVCAGAALSEQNQAANYHFGLGLEAYTHFTSPIRRYADLVVHRQLLEVMAGLPPRKAAPEPKKLEAPPPPPPVVFEPMKEEEDEEVDWAAALGGEDDGEEDSLVDQLLSAAGGSSRKPGLPDSAAPLPAIELEVPAEPAAASEPDEDAAEVARVCRHINERHRAAKLASTRSESLFFSLYFQSKHEPTRESFAGLVVGIDRERRGATVYVPYFDWTSFVRLGGSPRVYEDDEEEDDDNEGESESGDDLNMKRVRFVVSDADVPVSGRVRCEAAADDALRVEASARSFRLRVGDEIEVGAMSEEGRSSLEEQNLLFPGPRVPKVPLVLVLRRGADKAEWISAPPRASTAVVQTPSATSARPELVSATTQPDTVEVSVTSVYSKSREIQHRLAAIDALAPREPVSLAASGSGRRSFRGFRSLAPILAARQEIEASDAYEDEYDQAPATSVSSQRAEADRLKRLERDSMKRIQKLQAEKYDSRVKRRHKAAAKG